MPDLIWFKALLKALILPPTGLLLLSLAGLGMQRRLPRAGRAFALCGVLLLLLLSMPVVAAWLVQTVYSSPPLDVERARSAQAIVILGGGTRRDAVEYGGDTLGRLTLERVRYGARVARSTGLPILVSGGVPLEGGASEAKLMKDALENEFGVVVRWTEDRSRNTHENAVRTAEMLRSVGIRRIVLVAHGFDMPRAEAEFAEAGIETVPAPTGVPTRIFNGPLSFVPSIAGLEGSYLAIYEILANAVFWVVRAA